MIAPAIEELLNLLDVSVDAFAVCEIAKTGALQYEPLSDVVIHFVLEGRGVLQCEHGQYELGPSTVVVVPRHTPKTLAGEGPIQVTNDGKDHCVLEDGLMKFTAGTGQKSLVLGCAAVQVSIRGIVDVFEHLWEPMIDEVGPTLDPVVKMIEIELSAPKVGTRAAVGALMKQVLISLFRAQLQHESYRSWLWPAILSPTLGRAALAIMSRPQDSHTVASLAAMAGMSRARFAEQFNESFGRTPMKFVQEVRLTIARRLLVDSSVSVKSAAAAVGYASRAQFSRAYEAKFGHPPSSRC